MRQTTPAHRTVLPAALLAALALGGCAQTAYDAAPGGVGFGNYTDYAAQREAQLTGAVPDPALSGPVYAGTGVAAGAVPGAGPGAVPGSVAGAGPSAQGRGPGLSDEQSFDAVTGRETIESDAERLARARASYRQVAPGALPERPRDTGPNIVAFALSTTHARGQAVYPRSGGSSDRMARACARYASSDQAQQAFLTGGGPERDRQGVDPDGDGYACGWDPAPFRTIRR